jgi:hypothetical protein
MIEGEWVGIFIILQCPTRVHSFFQRELSTQCDILLPLSIFSTLSFLKVIPVTAYVFFFVFPYPSLYLSFNSVFWKQFLLKL